MLYLRIYIVPYFFIEDSGYYDLKFKIIVILLLSKIGVYAKPSVAGDQIFLTSFT